MKLRNGTEVAPIASGGIAQKSKTFQTIAQHNASSPFLMLPQEIKNRIYHFVCGGQMVHILQNDKDHQHVHSDDTVKLSHAICIESSSEEKIQKDFDSADPITVGWNIAGIEHRHGICQQSSKRKKIPEPKLSLTHLHCCRQMYLEARSVQYTNNTFAIYCNHILERFAKARFQNQQHLAIRSLYLEITIMHPSDIDTWSTIIRKAVLRRLKNVRYLHLNMVQLYCACTFRDCGYKGSEMTERQAKMLKKLGKLPLRKATMIIDDSGFGLWDGDPTDETEQRWTMEEKQDFSRKIRAALLA